MRQLVLLAAVTFVIHCGGDAGTTDADDSGAASTADASGVEEASTLDASGTAHQDASAPKANSGFVVLIEGVSLSDNALEWNANAGFEDQPAPAPAACYGQQVGSCCYNPGTPVDGGAANTGGNMISAGTIKIARSGNLLGTMVPSSAIYPSLSSSSTPTLAWTAGDMLTVSATGAAVHAFSGNVKTVALFANVSPGLSTTALPMSRTSNFTISWTKAAGDVSLYFSVGVQSILCAAPSDPGSFTIDKSLLAKLPQALASLSLTRTIRTDISSDNANVEVLSEAEVAGIVTLK